MPVNVRDFGTRGDGFTDDTHAFLDALAAGADANYHVVVTPTAKGGRPKGASNRVESVDKLPESLFVVIWILVH